MNFVHKKTSCFQKVNLTVQAERLELSHLAALDPKSSVSTNSTTPAKGVQIYTNVINHKEVPLYFSYF